MKFVCPLFLLAAAANVSACYWSRQPVSANVLKNNAYETRRLPDKQVAQQSGYVVSDPGNIIATCRACDNNCWYGKKTDPECIAKVNNQVRDNIGIPIAYMSLTIEPGRQDLLDSDLEKGTDYTTGKMSGWDEYGPKLTKKYKQFMIARIENIAKSGYIGVEFDNVDIIHNVKDTGISYNEWRDFVLDITRRACTLGLVPVQKNTVPDWTNDDLNAFEFGAIMLEIEKLPGKYTFSYSQIQYYADNRYPIFITNYNQDTCDTVADHLKKWIDINSGSIIVDCQKGKGD